MYIPRVSLEIIGRKAPLYQDIILIYVCKRPTRANTISRASNLVQEFSLPFAEQLYGATHGY